MRGLVRWLPAVALAVCALVTAVAAEPAASPKPKPAPKPSLAELRRLVAEQKATIEAQQAVIEEQQAKIGTQDAAIDEQKTKLAELETQLADMKRRLDEIEQLLPAAEEQQKLEERLARVEKEDKPDLPPNVVSAGDFPGSMKIPGTDAAVKFGGRIRTAAVFTLAPLGSDDRFLTNSIPVESTDAAAGEGRRTVFTANTSRFNFEMRTPTGVGQVRTFIEGDFTGSNVEAARLNFRLRHAYAQFHGFLVGQTWSTFSDPLADHQDMDFEGINGENVIRQAQVRYAWKRGKVDLAVAAETPQVSITGGQGVNQIPDLVGRAIWPVKDIGHFQLAGVLRQIRGQWTLDPTVVQSSFAWGATMSGVVPFHYFKLTDRLIFQLNVGEGNARYINDLNSLGGQDAVFDDATGNLEPLAATGGYIDFEHQWTQWETTRVMKLRSSFIWSFVAVDNLGFQPPDAYRKTNRFSANLVFSPIDRIDMGVEYIYGSRENKNGLRGTSDQFQVVGIFRF